LHPKIKPSDKYLLSGVANKTTIYMIGENKYYEAVWVRITDINGKLLKRLTIEGIESGKVVAEKISKLSHHYATTG
jgi:hypothetical protein